MPIPTPERREKSGVVGVVLIVATMSGCGEELGPEFFPTTRVEGTIRIAGQPITSGWVEFLPDGGTRGNLRSAPIRTDGSFAIDSVPVGRVIIGLAAVHGPPILTSLGPVERGTFRFFSTPIRRVIPAGPSSRVDVDLAVEAEAFLRDRLAFQRRLNDPSE